MSEREQIWQAASGQWRHKGALTVLWGAIGSHLETAPTKTGTEKANESVLKKQDKEGGEKGPAITTIFSPHQGHGWRGETRENRAPALSRGGQGRREERVGASRRSAARVPGRR